MFLFFIYLLLFTGLLSFISRYKHLISILISIEVMMMSLFFYLLYFFMEMMNSMMIFLFLCFMVGDGCIGLGMFVSYIRFFSMDFLMEMSLLKML